MPNPLICHNTLIIRQLDIDDAVHAVDIFSQMYAYYFSEPPTPEAIARYLTERVLAAHSSVGVAGAFVDQKLMGFATYTILYPAPNLSGQMFMKDLFVSASARGQRLGPKLMQYIAQVALEHDCERLDWTAEQSNPNAGKFYRALGADQIIEKEYYRFTGAALAAFAKQNSPMIKG
ncbi:GNAT family N-acetyltransferase [Celerinatantimonas yamalensis]|uniref:GNAT family N-acetyltransferase n=1 Tax=Celerinatantimonas yamalensis TaxID=559956 RepID=A0ABW9G2J8_9GAMM